MKTWNTPVISELNINETTNGRRDSDFERGAAWNDNDRVTPPVDPVDDPS